MKQYKSLRRSELQKLLEFTCYFEHITTKIGDDHRPHRVIDDMKVMHCTMCILDAMKIFQKHLTKAWTPDYFVAHCANCNIFIDGCISDTDNSTWIGAYLGIPNTPVEFIIHYLGNTGVLEDSDEFSTLENLHYTEEGKVLKLDENFKIIK